MKKNIVKIIAVILFICILIITIVLISIYKQGKNNSRVIGDQGETIEYYEKEERGEEYYIARNCINIYLDALNKNSSTYVIGNKIDENLQKEYIYSLLNEEYIKNNNITEENILNNVKTYNEKNKFIPLEISVISNENINRYIAKGFIKNIYNKYIEDLNIIVELDLENKTFDIIPIKNNNDYNNIKIDNIKLKKYNNFVYPKIDTQYFVNEYLELYKSLALCMPDIAYEKLDNEYKTKRFENIEEFKKYIDDNKTQISKIKLEEYAINDNETYIEYIAKDQYDNIYFFRQTDNLDYSIILDDYTLETSKFNETYKNATDKEKVLINLDKFFNMINSKDYKSAYKVLAQSFKNNYFRTQESFEKFMKETFYSYNKPVYMNFSSDISGIYTYHIEVLNKENTKDDTIKMNVIMQLLEGTNYQISFEIIK